MVEALQVLVTIVIGIFLIGLVLAIPFAFSLFRAIQEDWRNERKRMHK